MSKFARAAHPAVTGSRMSEMVMEAGMMAAAAAFTATVWLSIGTVAVTPAAADTLASTGPHYILPTVYIVGDDGPLAGTPTTTTAQNTAAIPVTLHQ